MFSHNSTSCPGKCHFIQDRRDADRYTCLPCGKVRYTSSDNPFEAFIAIILAIIVVGLFVSSCSYSSPAQNVSSLENEKTFWD
ncbi:MAG: hypothetical protein AAF329_25285 [Cyanobacteria bacterium P01_A01_bin.17]